MRKQKTESPVRAIMNVTFCYCRMLLSEAPYWGSSTWVRTKGAKVVWWSTSPRLRAWFPLQVVLFMLPRSMQLSALLALSEYVLLVGMWIFYTRLSGFLFVVFFFGWFPGNWILYADVSEYSVCSETSAHKIRTPKNYPKERTQLSK